MAITINQEPTFPNVTYTNLLYAVSSNHVTASQFQYVMDVVSGSEVLTRVKQFPNPAGSAIFDPSRIMNDYLEYDQSWKINDVVDITQSVQTFEIKFGEEYSDSVSGSVVLYNGNDITGSPAVTGTPSQVFPGTVDPNNGVSYNWVEQPRLSDRPNNIGISVDDYSTVSIYNDGTVGSVSVNYNPGTNETYTLSPGFNTIPIGSKNISTNTSFEEIILTVDGETTRYVRSEDCNWDRVNFAFINNYGMWDYYGVNLPQAKRTNVKREEITTPFVDYSSATSQYDVTRRGKGYFNTSYTESLSVYTDWLDQETAEWLTQMLESPEVFVQVGDNFIPITITNSSFEHNTNRAAQKTFQYQIQYMYSNQRRSR